MLRAIPVFLIAALAIAADGGIAPPPRVGVGILERRLTLEQALELAFRANLDVAIERTNVDTASEGIRAARGGFDPVLRWQPSAGDSNTPVASSLDGAAGLLTQHSAGQSFAWHQKSPWNGLQLDAEFDSSRVTSANPFVSLSPFYTTQLTLTVTQPLLRGRALDGERALVRIRSNNRDASAAQLEIRALDVAARTELAYWDLVAARRQSSVDAEAANLAKAQLEQDRRKIAAGSLPSVELSAAEAALEARLDDLYRSTGAVTEAENNLKTLLTADRRDTLWDDQIVPADCGAVAPPVVIEVVEAMAEALRRRPELRVIDANLAANDVEKKQNADLVKPQMNLVASYSLAGLAGRIRQTPDPFTAVATPLYQRVDALSAAAGLPVLPTPATGVLPNSLGGGLGSSLSNLFGGSYQTFQAGVAFDFTIHNRAAEAGLAGSAVAEKRLHLMRDRAELAIQAQVRNALQSLETARQRMRAADAGAQAARDKLDSETRLFETGESTNFLVLTRQTDYSAARRRQVEADTAFNKAVSQYETALGTTLASRGIRVE